MNSRSMQRPYPKTKVDEEWQFKLTSDLHMDVHMDAHIHIHKYREPHKVNIQGEREKGWGGSLVVECWLGLYM